MLLLLLCCCRCVVFSKLATYRFVIHTQIQHADPAVLLQNCCRHFTRALKEL